MKLVSAIKSKGRAIRSGLTLVELLVAIAILGVLATGIVPSVQALMAHAQSEDIEARLRTSWQLAIAIAQAQAKPVVWQAHADPTALQLSICDAQYDPVWSISLPVGNATIFVGDSTQGQSDVRLVVFPHGLTQIVAVEWQTERARQRVSLQDMPPARVQEQ
ncbi:MAG TPA: type II secretion system protein [Phycisphaerae bacterium]|nr:type II secretion system protein [Phycisphaerae bacterium]